VCVVDVSTCVDRFDLKLVSAESSDVIRCWIEYDASRYSDRDVQRFSEELLVLVDDAARHPDTPLIDLCLLSERDQYNIVEQLNRGARSAGRAAAAACVHTTFEARVNARVNQPAVACEDHVLTYGELNTRANRLAWFLQRRGVASDTLVAVCLERSADLIISILATLKAGGAYVPLDPSLPAGRLEAIVQQSRASLVLTRAAFREMLPSSAPTVVLEVEAGAIAAESDNNPVSSATPQHLAYVLFTSGSTGSPKGVAVEHRQIVSYTRAVSQRLALPDDAACATVTTLASDLGNTAIFAALLAGGCLHVITEHRASDPHAFAEYFSRHRIDLLKIVPSHLSALLSVTDLGRVLPRKRLVLGGEACSWDLVDVVRQLAPGCVVFNHYGPTETTVGATVFQVSDDGERPPSLTVPIGRPLSHVSAYVVDRNERPVPVWIAGELLIGGEGVARGYLHAPELTNERFLPDPFTPGADSRMYRTGDLVRLLPGGDLEFLGRVDDQVKIRGYRVEPGEIASLIRRHPDVRDATVLVRDSDRQLAAYVVSKGVVPSAQQITAYLKLELPEYMVPASIVMLDALPLTPNGKIDRAALLAMAAAPPTLVAPAGQPSSEWERLIAGVWRELLAIDEIAVEDNFYDLGGHSLLAIQVIAALEKRTGLGISPRDLAFHTLKQFAARCELRMPLAATSPSSP
jgi:amino acid adenylation domain-containing protein